MLSVAKIGKRNKEQNFFPVFFLLFEKKIGFNKLFYYKCVFFSLIICIFVAIVWSFFKYIGLKRV